MAKRPSKHTRPVRPLSPGHASGAAKRDGAWIARSVTGAATVKTYTCPHCARPISPGTPHVVAWPSEPEWTSQSAVAERRHWHSGCWQRKL